MSKLKTLAPLLTASAMAALACAGHAFAQGESVANTTQPYSPTAPANCCIYAPPGIPGQNVRGMHIYLWSGLKSHGEGQHDYPQLLADWSKVLTDQGAVVEGGFHPPTKDELAWAEVVIIYKGDAGYMTPEEHQNLMDYVKRGGGFVNFHDTLCGPDPADMAYFLGAGKRHGETNFTLETPMQYTVTDPTNPIVAGTGLGDLKFTDEEFYKMTMAPSGVHPLATVVIAATPSGISGGGAGQTVPQLWTYEHTAPGGQPSRAFVWMQGHVYENFSNPVLKKVILRGIAWAGKHPVGELENYTPPANPGRGGGRGGRGGAPGAAGAPGAGGGARGGAPAAAPAGGRAQ
ncbi:MAG: ThuA domain-containing protein [Alphaproteobacteria bacterium]|nr:ThuA domain-containing protein [Alphaproteobacteria bacterium]